MAGDAPSRAMKPYIEYPQIPRLVLRRGRTVRRRSAVGGATKRLADIVLAATALVLTAPVMLVVAMLSRAATGAPAIFAHPRVGHGGRIFHCYKFRTMSVVSAEDFQRCLDADPALKREWQETQKLRHDPRVTRIGRVLRKSSLDELPQLFNVIVGDMSLVGPRPIVADELARYGSARDEYLSARPGITGLWQVSGRNGLSYRERVALDRAYVRRWSWGLDLYVMLKTIPALLDHSGTS